jgi:hypothetical protein
MMCSQIFGLPGFNSEEKRVSAAGQQLGVCNFFLQQFLKNTKVNLSVCGSGMFIPDPDFYPSRIPDPRSQIQKQQEKRGVNLLS